MNLFEKLSKAHGVQMLCGITLAAEKTGDHYRFNLVPAPTERKTRPVEYALLALHYYSQVLARYPRSAHASELVALDIEEMIRLIIEEGIWQDTDVAHYAGVGDRMEISKEPVAKPALEIRAAVIRPVLGDDLDLALEPSAGMTDTEFVLSIVAVLQGVVPLLDAPTVKLYDFALRYLKSYHDEGADYGDAAAARNMANRAFREAGGEAA